MMQHAAIAAPPTAFVDPRGQRWLPWAFSVALAGQSGRAGPWEGLAVPPRVAADGLAKPTLLYGVWVRVSPLHPCDMATAPSALGSHPPWAGLLSF